MLLSTNTLKRPKKVKSDSQYLTSAPPCVWLSAESPLVLTEVVNLYKSGSQIQYFIKKNKGLSHFPKQLGTVVFANITQTAMNGAFLGDSF